MGTQGGSYSESKESKLSIEQANILKSREEQYQAYFFPELISKLEESKKPVLQSELMQGQSKAINQSYSQGNKQFQSQMAQRGLSGSGVEAQGLSGLASAKSSALSDAHYKTATAQRDYNSQILQMGGSLSPQPTTAAPVGSEGRAQGTPFMMSMLGGIGSALNPF